MRRKHYSASRYVAFSIGFLLLMVFTTLLLRPLLRSDDPLWADMIFPLVFCAVFLPLYLHRYGPVVRPRRRTPIGELLQASRNKGFAE